MNSGKNQLQATTTQPTGRRAAFSLLEMLVVIGVIAVLITIAVFVYRSTVGGAKDRATRVTLSNGEGLIKQMIAVGAFNRLQGPADYMPPPLYAFDNNGQSPPIDPPVDQATALLLSRNVLVVMSQNPELKKAISALPSDALASVPDPTAPGDPTKNRPALIDAWGNAIIFVPAGGLKNVKNDVGATVTVTSSGKLPKTPPVAGDIQNQPFWCSPGPDGNYSTGADNIYSFQAK